MRRAQPMTKPPAGPSMLEPGQPQAPLAVAAGHAPQPSDAHHPGGYRAVLGNRLFLFLWLAQLFSQTAQNVVNYVLVVEVERLTHSSTNVGWVVVSFSLPVLLLGPSAGVFVDRVGKRGVLLWTNVLRGALMAGYLFVPQTLQAIYIVTFAASVVSQFFAPAEGAILPLMVRRRELLTATSLFNITFTVAQVAGFVVVGPTLYKLFGPTPVFIAVVVMYALAALCVWTLPRREQITGSLWPAISRALQLRHVWGDMVEASRFLRSTPGIGVAIVHLTLATALLMTLATLGPGFVARVLGLGPEDAGYILAPAGLGMLVTTVLLGHFAVNANRELLASRGLMAMSLSLAALALVRPIFGLLQSEFARVGPGALPAVETVGYLGIVCLITFSLGVEFAFVTIPAQTVVSEATEPSLRGRVFALLFMATGSVSTLPALVIGALADSVGIVPVLLVTAAAVFLAGAATWRRQPHS